MMLYDTYRACALAHVNLALQVEDWTSRKSKRLEVGVKCNMPKIVVVVSASEWANKSFIDHATVAIVVNRKCYKCQ